MTKGRKRDLHLSVSSFLPRPHHFPQSRTSIFLSADVTILIPVCTWAPATAPTRGQRTKTTSGTGSPFVPVGSGGQLRFVRLGGSTFKLLRLPHHLQTIIFKRQFWSCNSLLKTLQEFPDVLRINNQTLSLHRDIQGPLRSASTYFFPPFHLSKPFLR